MSSVAPTTRTDLVAEDLWFGYGQSWVLQGVDLRLAPSEVLGLYGPSGCGKSTLGRLLAGRLAADRGRVLAPPPSGRAAPVQLLVQHPETSLNPRRKVRQALLEAAPDLAPVVETDLVHRSWLDAFPHELSGGELQRVSLARALLVRPSYLVADEVTASLDPITQVQIWRLLLAGTRNAGYGVLAISHDMDLLGQVADRVVALEDLTR